MLHKYMLAMSPKLEKEIQVHIVQSAEVPYSTLVLEAWNWDPPKALADMFEAVIGAILVDSGFDLDRTFAVMEPLMEPVVSVVSPNIPKDPITEFMIWCHKSGCRAVKFQLSGAALSVRIRPETFI